MGLATLHGNMRAAFRERLLTLSDTDFAADRVAWEGEKFFPASNTPYFSESFRAGPSNLRSIANGPGGGTIEHRLMASVTLFFPDGKGTLAIERAGGAVMALFPPALKLTRSGDAAVISNTQRSALYDADGRLGCAVNIDLLAFTQN